MFADLLLLVILLALFFIFSCEIRDRDYLSPLPKLLRAIRVSQNLNWELSTGVATLSEWPRFFGTVTTSWGGGWRLGHFSIGTLSIGREKKGIFRENMYLSKFWNLEGFYKYHTAHVWTSSRSNFITKSGENKAIPLRKLRSYRPYQY